MSETDAVPSSPALTLAEAQLPAGFPGAVAEVILRGVFFYPGVTALGLLAVGLQEGGWSFPALAGVAAGAVGLLWGACLADNNALAAVAEETSPEAPDAGIEPTFFAQLFQGIFRVVSEVLGEAGEGCAGALATFGIALVLFVATLALGLLLLPVIAFAWSPTWLRAACVLAPPLPLTGLFALVTYVRLRRAQKARDRRLAAAAEEAALAARPEA